MKFILIGFMGAGKSTVAKLLAKKLNYSLIEMDEIVLKKSKRKSINEIFQKDGELYFRELEIAVAKDLKDKDKVVISTGGGVVINKIILDYLKKGGKTIYLKTSFSEILKRLKNCQGRPLFKDKKLAKKLFNFRKYLYQEYADLIVETDKKSVEEIIYEIISKN